MSKATNLPLTAEYLADRAFATAARGYDVPKWIGFCQVLLGEGYEVSLYEARRTVSKYVTVRRGGRAFKVRFSNHKPIASRELAGDCDFFVGVTHLSVTTTAQAYTAVQRFFAQKESAA